MSTSELNRKHVIITFVGALVVFLCLSISQVHTEFVVANEILAVHISGQTPAVSAAKMFLRMDDMIEISTYQIGPEIPIIVSISFLGHPSVSSSPSSGANLNWICNGDQAYAIDIASTNATSAEQTLVFVHYQIKRGIYQAIGLFPIGLVFGGVLILIGLESSQEPETIIAVREDVGQVSLLKRTGIRVFKKSKNVDLPALLVLVIFTAVSLSISVDMIHNDEIGGGMTDNWGYYAWGYVDTANQVADLLAHKDFSYDSWHAVQNMSKPIFGIYLMALFVMLFPRLDPLIASRLVVEISAALACLVTYFMVKRLFDQRAGIIASTLLFFSPVFLQYTRAAYLEGPAILLTSLFFLFLHEASLGVRRYLYLAGFVLGLAISTKSPMLLYSLLSLAFIWFLARPRMKAFGRYVLDALISTGIICFISLVVFFVQWPVLWINPLSKLAFLGMFFGLLGQYGPGFGVSYPTLFLGTIGRPNALIQILVNLMYQTTYVELFGFMLAIVFLIGIVGQTKTSRSLWLVVSIFVLTLIGSTVLYQYQHHLIYLIWPYAIMSGVGYAHLATFVESKLSSVSHRSTLAGLLNSLAKRRTLLSSLLLTLIGISQMGLVTSSAPYYGLYYNSVFLYGRQPTQVFQIPEPVYGLDQVSDYLKQHPSSTGKILTTNSPHTVQTYFPEYTIKKEHVFPWADDSQNMLILRSLGFEYVIVGESAIQVYPSLPLKRTLDKYGQLVMVAKSGDITLAYLYHIPEISWTETLWQNTLQNAYSWHSTTNTDFSSFLVTPEGQIVINANFTSGYPPSLAVKLYQVLPHPIDLSGSSLYSVLQSSTLGDVTITVSLVDQYGAGGEAILKPPFTNFAEETVVFSSTSDLQWKELPDFTKIVRIELNFYNAKGRTAEVVKVKRIAFVR